MVFNSKMSQEFTDLGFRHIHGMVFVMKKSAFTLYKFFIPVLFSPLLINAQNSTELHPSLLHSILLVDESWNVLDSTVSEVWPAWNCYKDEIYFTAIPEVQDILINPPENPGEQYCLLDLTIQGKPVYLRDPSPVKKVYGGGYRFKIGKKRYKAAQFHPPSKEYSAKVVQGWKKKLHLNNLPPMSTELSHSSEFFMQMIIHEAFHRWQFRLNKMKAVNVSHPSPFFGNKMHDALLELEGKILATAYLCENQAKLIELSRQFLAVRQERRKTLTKEDIDWEQRNEYVEGSAQYVETKVYTILNKNGYKPKVLRNGERGFSGFRYGEVLRTLITLKIQRSPKLSDDESQAIYRCYYFGLAQGFILDGLCGQEWKKIFFEDGVYFDTLLEKYCRFEKGNYITYLNNAKNGFNFSIPIE